MIVEELMIKKLKEKIKDDKKFLKLLQAELEKVENKKNMRGSPLSWIKLSKETSFMRQYSKAEKLKTWIVNI